MQNIYEYILQTFFLVHKKPPTYANASLTQERKNGPKKQTQNLFQSPRAVNIALNHQVLWYVVF
jgi:hypothetical protein